MIRLLKKIFGGGNQNPPPPERDVAALAAPFAKPAAQLLKVTTTTRSYFGGTPALPFGTTWPAKDGKPLTFLVCVDLESLQRESPQPWLPASGQLLFFYDTEVQPWGFGLGDAGGWAVLHVRGIVAPSADDDARLPLEFIECRAVATYPSSQRQEIAASQLTTLELEQLDEAVFAEFGDNPLHQIGGWPYPIQNDEMEKECELVAQRGQYDDAAEYRKRAGAQLDQDAARWRLLLQIDSDDDLKVMWGDRGMLYFWIREHDARDGRFDKVHIVLQCH